MNSIDKLTSAGISNLNKRSDYDEAVKSFETALRNAENQDRPDSNLILICKSNLGAAMIALLEYDEGLLILEPLVEKKSDISDQRYGNIFYNIGLAYEAKDQIRLAYSYFTKALNCYKGHNTEIEALLYVKLGQLSSSLGDHSNSAEMYHEASKLYKNLEDFERMFASLCKQMGELHADHKTGKAIEVANHIYKECQKMPDQYYTSYFFNEIGLHYIRFGLIKEAIQCFLETLELPRCNDKRTKAVLHQNIGAGLDISGKYHEALEYHKKAIKLHAQAKNRNAQGQCFYNKAATYSHLGRYDDAYSYYLHALQAAEDADDAYSKAQALEGLSTIEDIKSHHDKAIEYIEQALVASSSMKASDESDLSDNGAIQRRLINKLKDLHAKMIYNRRSNSKDSDIDYQDYGEQKHNTSSGRGHKATSSRTENGKRGDPDEESELSDTVNQREAYRRELDKPADADSDKQELDDKNDETSEDDDETSSDDSSSSSNQEIIINSMPQHTAPQPPGVKINTYELPAQKDSSAKMKTTGTSEDNPLYSTIKVTNRTISSDSADSAQNNPPTILRRAPSPPPLRKISTSSSSSVEADEDAEASRRRESLRRVSVKDTKDSEQQKEDDIIPLPTKKSKESKTCSVM